MADIDALWKKLRYIPQFLYLTEHWINETIIKVYMYFFPGVLYVVLIAIAVSDRKSMSSSQSSSTEIDNNVSYLIHNW